MLKWRPEVVRLLWFSVGFLLLAGIVMIAMRGPLARGQALVVGARMGPALVVAEGIVLIVVAMAIVIADRVGAFAE